MANVKIPMAVSAAVASILDGSHATLESLFETVGVTGEAPDLPHHSKWKTWLYKAGKDPNINSLKVLGGLLEEFMDLPPANWDPEYENWKEDRIRVNDILRRHGFHYSQGGNIVYKKKAVSIGLEPEDSHVWPAGNFRLFMSHVSDFKENTAYLQRSLTKYGITAFVAHENIKPTKEWHDEIENALFSMDALAAVLSPGFDTSPWTDHEVGIAIGRGVLVIPIRRGMDPYGFIAKYQGIQGSGKKVSEVANEIFNVLRNNEKTRERILSVLIEQFLFANELGVAKDKLNYISSFDNIDRYYLGKIKENTLSNSLLAGSAEIKKDVNNLLRLNSMGQLKKKADINFSKDDDLPF